MYRIINDKFSADFDAHDIIDDHYSDKLIVIWNIPLNTQISHYVFSNFYLSNGCNGDLS